jgi:hypothetical protein
MSEPSGLIATSLARPAESVAATGELALFGILPPLSCLPAHHRLKHRATDGICSAALTRATKN